MKSFKTRASVLQVIATFSIILGFCHSSESFSQAVKVYSMKVDASKFLDFQNYDLLVLSFRKELIGGRYLAEGKASPDPTPKKIKLNKYSDSSFDGYSLRILDLPKESVIKFISELDRLYHIKLREHISEYDIIFKAYPENDFLGNYVNYTIWAKNKNTRAISTTSVRTNPCPPCHYSSIQ